MKRVEIKQQEGIRDRSYVLSSYRLDVIIGTRDANSTGKSYVIISTTSTARICK